MQAAFAASSGSFASDWQSADGYGYSVSSIDVNAWSSGSELDSYSRQEKRGWLNHDIVKMSIDLMVASLFQIEGQTRC